MNTFIKLYEGQPGVTNTTLYTCPANTRVRILAATATNDTTVAKYFSAHLVPFGGSVSDANIIINQKSLGSRESYHCPELVGHILDPGDIASSIAEAADQITLHISGVSIV